MGDENNELAITKARLEAYEKRYGKFGDIRNLFIRKPTLNDWLTLICIAGVIILAYFYSEETKLCRETLPRLKVDACSICIGNASGNQNYSSGLANNITFVLSINEDNESLPT